MSSNLDRRPLSRRFLLTATTRVLGVAGLSILTACGQSTTATSGTSSASTAAGTTSAASSAPATSVATTASSTVSQTATSSSAATSSTTAALSAASTTTTAANTTAAAPSTAATSSAASTAAATTASAAKAATGAPATVRVWGFGLDDAFAKARLQVFQQASPNITVKPVGGSLNTQQLLTAVASGDPPEVVSFDRTQTGSWAGRNGIDPIDDLVSVSKFDLGQFYPFSVDQVKYQGKLYGVPQFVTCDLLYINNDVLQKAGVDPTTVDPGNWEQLQSLGAKLHVENGGKVTRTGFDTKMQDGRLWYWSWANGDNNLISADGRKAQFTDPKIVEALTWGKATVDMQGGDKARAAFSQTQNFFSAQNPVIIGQIAMTIFEQWLIGVLSYKPDLNFTAMVPRKRHSTDGLTTATGSVFAIPHGIKGNPREGAWSFISGMTSTQAWVDGAKAAAEKSLSVDKKPYTATITGNIQADQQIWTQVYKPISKGFDDAVKLFPELVKVSMYPYSGPVANEVSDALTADVNDALQGAKTPEAALGDLNKKAQSAIDNFAKGPGNR